MRDGQQAPGLLWTTPARVVGPERQCSGCLPFDSARRSRLSALRGRGGERSEYTKSELGALHECGQQAGGVALCYLVPHGHDWCISP